MSRHFWSGVFAAIAVGLVIFALVLSVAATSEKEMALNACRAKDGILVAEVNGHYACINTSALYDWYQQ